MCLFAINDFTSFIRDFENEVRSSQLVTLIEGVLTGTESDRNYVIRTLHDQYSTGNVMSISSADVLLLCFLLFQVLYYTPHAFTDLYVTLDS